MVRTPEESRIESAEEIAKERQEVRELLARGELEASLTHVKDTRNGDMARFRLMRFGFVVDSISLNGTTPKRYFFNGHFPDTERKHMREIMSSKVHAKLALALDGVRLPLDLEGRVAVEVLLLILSHCSIGCAATGGDGSSSSGSLSEDSTTGWRFFFRQE